MQTYSNFKRAKVLGVKIDDVSKEEGLEIVERWRGGGKLIFTPGPEFLVTAQRDLEFKRILNAGDLNLPDGYGLKIFGGITHVVPGVEFMLALCELAVKNNLTIGLLGGQDIVAQKTAQVLKAKFPKIRIAFAIEEPDVLRYSDILFVAFGHPKQEKFLYRLKKDEPLKGSSFLVGMGVGGSFDFISGQVPEPGTIYRRLGLKWLGRFLARPAYMLPKIYKAVVLFPLLILKDKFS